MFLLFAVDGKFTTVAKFENVLKEASKANTILHDLNASSSVCWHAIEIAVI